MLLTELGDALKDQGRYAQAQKAYEDRLKIARQQKDFRGQAVALGQIGNLAEIQGDYSEARLRLTEAHETFRALGEPQMEAVAWHQLGIVAEGQQDWAEAERCYRESLMIKERLSDANGASNTCNQLAIVSRKSGRSIEAEGWYKRTLELDVQVHPGSYLHALTLNNLAFFLLDEVRKKSVTMARLTEAQDFAEQALAIKETLDSSSEIWTTLSILADIADLEGHVEESRNYRRRERKTYAAFEGNRYHIDRQHGQLIADIVAAAKGDTQARAKVEAALPQFEAKDWHITNATQRIWAGERDWDTLVEGLDGEDALLILRVLENIARSEEAQSITAEQVIASLPAVIREAMERGDQAAFEKAFGVLLPEEQQGVVTAIQFLQGQRAEEGSESE